MYFRFFNELHEYNQINTQIISYRFNIVYTKMFNVTMWTIEN